MKVRIRLACPQVLLRFYDAFFFFFLGDRRFKCDLCSKSYFENHLLQVHKLVHTKIRHYCNICGKDYVRLMSLTRHMHSHSDVKPFACNICNYSSIEKHSVKKHMMKKHNLYDEQIKNG